MVQESTTTPEYDCDVLVMGGGPAGSTIATLLAQKNWRVTLLEKDRHPRFHIGESLLPMNLEIFERLGLLEAIRQIGVVKRGAEFGSTRYPHKRCTYFKDALDKRYPFAFHVRRAEFDELLLRHSAAQGVAVREGLTVRNAEFESDGVVIDAADENNQTLRLRARYLVDASGRDTFLARKFGFKKKNLKHQSAAVFGHFQGVERLPGEDAGNISIYWFPHGWFWLIPLRDEAMSVGAVCWPEYLKTRGDKSLEQFLWDTVALCPDAARRMANAKLSGQVWATGNYSYRSTRFYGERYVLIGDAYAFIDPVFSTGVFLAMRGAELGAEAVDAWLRDPQAAAPRFRRIEAQLERAMDFVSWFIYRFTSPAMHHLFMNPRDRLGIPQAIVSMLAGDLFNTDPRIMRPITIFKGIYYLTALGQVSKSWMAYRLRKRNIAAPFNDGTTPQDAI